MLENQIAGETTKSKYAKYNDIVECFGLPEYRDEPNPFYKYFRESKPFYHSPLVDAWFVFSYEDVLAVYKDKRFARGDNSYTQQLGVDAGRSFGNWMQWRNGKEHLRVRNMIQPAFAKVNVAAMTASIDSSLDFLLQSLPEKGSYDIYNEYLYKLPVLIICDVLGIPRDDFPTFVKWSTRLGTAMDPGPTPEKKSANDAVIQEMEAYLKPLIEKKLAQPGRDLISVLAAARNTPEGLNDEELMSQIIMLFFAGHETTTNQLAFGMVEFLKNKDQWALLQNSEEHYDTAVEEILRHQTSVVFIQYRVQEDMVFKGQNLKKGTVVWIFLPSANRDANVFENPDKFDIRRTHNPHLAFGKGVHQCLGADLSRVEMKLSFQKLVKKLNGRNIELESYALRSSLFIRGFETLKVRIG